MPEPEQTMTATELNDLRQKVLSGEEYSKDFLRNVIRTLVGDRIQQTQAQASASSTRAKRAPVKLDDLL